MRKLQKKMASLFEKQKLKGGIIDIEGERNRYLIDISSVCGTAPFNKTQVCRHKVDFSRLSSISRKYLSMLLRCWEFKEERVVSYSNQKDRVL